MAKLSADDLVALPDAEQIDVMEEIQVENVQRKEAKQKSENKLGVYTGFKDQDKYLTNLEAQADKLFEQTMNLEVHTEEASQVIAKITKIGDAEIKTVGASADAVLNKPLKALRQDDGGDATANALKNLREVVTKLDPKKRLETTGEQGILSFLNPFKKKVDSYMAEYKSSESLINDIVTSLLNGKEDLEKDNAWLKNERGNMYKSMQKMEQYVYLIGRLDEKISEALPQIKAEDQIRYQAIEQEILFPIRQKRMDMYQHLAVCMQSYTAYGILVKNNEELIKGVDRAQNTTITALKTAVIISEALGTQRLVLNQINALNETTTNLIESNSLLLKVQGAEIQKQATESAVGVEALNRSFENIFQAMDAMDTYRSQALPKMSQNIDALQKVYNKAKEKDQAQRMKRAGNINDIIGDTSPDAPKNMIKV